MENIPNPQVRKKEKEKRRIRKVLRIIPDLILRPKQIDLELKSMQRLPYRRIGLYQLGHRSRAYVDNQPVCG